MTITPKIRQFQDIPTPIIPTPIQVVAEFLHSADTETAYGFLCGLQPYLKVDISTAILRSARDAGWVPDHRRE